MQHKKPYIIVIGNEKGGVGKTTVAMHLITHLLYNGCHVTSIDIDSRQRSLSNYLENRTKSIKDKDLTIPMPSHVIVNKSTLDSVEKGQEDEQERFTNALQHAAEKSDVVLIDSPGNDTFLSRLAHAHADLVITPINDSFVDFNLLAKVEDETFKMSRHGLYSEVVWQAKMRRMKQDKVKIDWVIMRNRLSHIDAHNKRNMQAALQDFSKRSGAHIADGLSERVIYKELFLKGLTLLDVIESQGDVNLTMSHIAAREELRKFTSFLGIDEKLAIADMNHNIAKIAEEVN